MDFRVERSGKYKAKIVLCPLYFYQTLIQAYTLDFLPTRLVNLELLNIYEQVKYLIF